MIGQGKYDDVLTEAKHKVGATSALFIVLDGMDGPGFSCQATLPEIISLPKILRQVAEQIEIDLNNGVL